MKPSHRSLRSVPLRVALVAALCGTMPLPASADDDSSKPAKSTPQAKQAAGDFDGIELGPKILKAINHGELIEDWSQAEIDAYYKVLDLAKRIRYEEQKQRARENALKQLELLEHDAGRDYEARKAEIDRQEEQLGKLQATRQRALAAQRHRQAVNQIEEYRENLATFPMHKWLVTEMFTSINDGKPSRYHGKLVTLRGHIRKLISYEAHENPLGIETLYEAWLYPIGAERFEADDPRTNPVVVVCTQIPEGMPTGDRIAEEATITGYVFRLHGYRSKIPLPDSGGKTKKLIAPMILASRIEWKPPSPAPAAPFWLKATILGGIAAIIVAIFLYSRRDKNAHRELVRQRLFEEDEGPKNPDVVVDPRTPPLLEFKEEPRSPHE